MGAVLSARVALAAIAAAMALAPRVAGADSPHLAEARGAIDAVRYDDAQRLLLEALHDGGNSPAAVRAIYQLAASTAVVLSRPDDAEQFYRRWLAIDPGATLPDTVAPKVREPFVAAQSFMAAHGPLTIRATRLSATDVLVELVADPLLMAKSACVAGGTAPAPFDPSGRARIAITPTTTLVAACDESGNRLLEVPATAPVALPPPAVQPYEPPPPPPPPRPIIRRWTTWVFPAIVTGVVAYSCYGRVSDDSDALAMDPTGTDAPSIRSDRNGYIIATSITGAAFLGFAVATLIFYFDEQATPRPRVVPLPAPGGGGTLSLVGAF